MAAFSEIWSPVFLSHRWLALPELAEKPTLQALLGILINRRAFMRTSRLGGPQTGVSALLMGWYGGTCFFSASVY